jgi:hypothetical protein
MKNICNFFTKSFAATKIEEYVKTEKQDCLLCCPLLDPQMAGTGELPPETMN